MIDKIYVFCILVILAGLLGSFISMWLLFQKKGLLIDIALETFPKKLLPAIFAHSASWCLSMAFTITFFRWFGAKYAQRAYELAQSRLSAIHLVLLHIQAISMTLFIVGIICLGIADQGLGLVPPWEKSG